MQAGEYEIPAGASLKQIVEDMSSGRALQHAVTIPEGYTTSTTFPPILVNIADLLSYWTNGYLKSTVHRVIFPKDARRGGEDRYSIAYFCHPSDDAELVPVPSKIVAERKMAEGEKIGYGGGSEGKKAMTAKEHLDKRLEATYDFKLNKKAQVVDATA